MACLRTVETYTTVPHSYSPPFSRANALYPASLDEIIPLLVLMRIRHVWFATSQDSENSVFTPSVIDWLVG